MQTHEPKKTEPNLKFNAEQGSGNLFNFSPCACKFLIISLLLCFILIFFF